MRPVLLAFVLLLVSGCHNADEGPSLLFYPALREPSGDIRPKLHSRFTKGQTPALVADGTACFNKEGFVELRSSGKFVSVSPTMLITSRGHWWIMDGLPPGNYTAVLHLAGQPRAFAEFIVEP